MIKKLTFVVTALAVVFLAGCGSNSNSGTDEANAKGNKHKIAYVTNGIDPFWDLCAAGVRQAESELGGVECEIHFPTKGLADQKSIMESLMAKGISGIAVSPVDADGQTKFLNEIASQTKLITHDADAPKSERLVYIGTDNYKAGRALGQLVKGAIPDGGEVAIFVGRLEQLNARQRRQGVIDELLDRPSQILGQIKFDEVAKVFKGEKYTIVDTRTDNFVMDAAKSNAEDAITKYENLACMVGLFAYNPPRCLQAIKEAGKLGKIKVCGFDEDDALLQAIKDGHAYGTISQQPWNYGYQSVKVLKSILDGDNSLIPPNKFIDLGYKSVTAENIDDFWSEKNKMAALGAKKD
ncbi:MAG: sugar-binding protein [Verrucomicrobiota bacterium]|nr:sugar-binding protein [Verrucomicrobiota bacterium]